MNDFKKPNFRSVGNSIVLPENTLTLESTEIDLETTSNQNSRSL
jgi:hypothetical protein